MPFAHQCPRALGEPVACPGPASLPRPCPCGHVWQPLPLTTEAGQRGSAMRHVTRRPEAGPRGSSTYYPRNCQRATFPAVATSLAIKRDDNRFSLVGCWVVSRVNSAHGQVCARDVIQAAKPLPRPERSHARAQRPEPAAPWTRPPHPRAPAHRQPGGCTGKAQATDRDTRPPGAPPAGRRRLLQTPVADLRPLLTQEGIPAPAEGRDAGVSVRMGCLCPSDPAVEPRLPLRGPRRLAALAACVRGVGTPRLPSPRPASRPTLLPAGQREPPGPSPLPTRSPGSPPPPREPRHNSPSRWPTWLCSTAGR